jgi:multidrug resistance efflux pump
MNDLENEIVDSKSELDCVNTLINCSNCSENVDDFISSISVADGFVYSQLEEYFKTVDYMKKQIAIYDFHYQNVKNQPDLLFNKNEVEKAFLELKLSQQELERYKANFLAENIQKQKTLELKLAKLEQELIRTKEQYSFLDISAPISGFVQEVSSLNVGDYVVENQNVLVIVPDDTKSFKVELEVPTKNIGEITSGMEVKYRLSAFPFLNTGEQKAL